MPKKWMPDGRWAPWRRGTLLFLFGVVVGGTYSDPGRWASKQVVEPLRPRPDIRTPLRLAVVSGPGSREAQVDALFSDMADDTDFASGRHVAPAPEPVAERLARVDGWDTAVLFETTAVAGDLRDAGLEDAEACVMLVGDPVPRALDRRDLARLGPLRSWRLVLLDEVGRQVAELTVCALRSGYAPDARAREGFVARTGAPGDGDLPVVSVFERTPDGVVRTG